MEVYWWKDQGAVVTSGRPWTRWSRIFFVVTVAIVCRVLHHLSGDEFSIHVLVKAAVATINEQGASRAGDFEPARLACGVDRGDGEGEPLAAEESDDGEAFIFDGVGTAFYLRPQKPRWAWPEASVMNDLISWREYIRKWTPQT